MSETASRHRPSRPHSSRPRSAADKLYRVLRSRLSTPLVSSLILIPILPSHQRNLLFEVLPFYRSCRALLARGYTSRKAREARYEQWLTYWLLYSLVRFCEETRYNLDTIRLPTHTTSLATYVVQLARWTVGRLAASRASSRPGRRLEASPSPALPIYPNSPTVPSLYPAKHQTLASQLAGTPRRWTVIKCVLLFYAMDEELQGARWILEKLIKPLVGFFTAIDSEQVAEETEADSRHLQNTSDPLTLKADRFGSGVRTEGQELEEDEQVCMSPESLSHSSSLLPCRVVGQGSFSLSTQTDALVVPTLVI